MSATTVQDTPQAADGAVGDPIDRDPFDLDIDVLELGGGTVPLITLTDDGCNPSCPDSCATNVA
ncbi:FxLD family lanthipeptide [Streptomyces sp. NPDC002845]